MDKPGAPKAAGVGRPSRPRGARLLYLSPCSPDLDPIEECWPKAKQFLRPAAARTGEAAGRAVTEAFDTVSLQGLRHWLAHCGYAVSEHATLT